MLVTLPEELCLQVALFLSAQDVLKVLILHRSLTPLGNSARFWSSLLERDSSIISQNNENAQKQKRAYLVYAHSSQLSRVQWKSVSQTSSPSPREGHLMCVLGSNGIVLTGGFCDDDRVHILSSSQQHWSVAHPPTQPSFVYGASLTPLDNTRAIRFGGFRAGGYSSETNQLCLLEVNSNNTTADWTVITPGGTLPTARAYHSATLVANRYILFIGGMTTRGSILEPCILDTETWTWLDTISDFIPSLKTPSGRHGHSVVYDEKRHRLVLFGGGSGSDLLRSGEDNTEVWSLTFSKSLESSNNNSLQDTLPWTWNKIYKNANTQQENDEQDDTDGKASGLSPAERLVLGRCHAGCKVSRDMVLLMFGSGHPTTNGVLAYNLATDKFHRPNVGGPLPIPRFSAAAALTKDGFAVIHGGYTTQVDGTRGDLVLLDLAPQIRRSFSYLPESHGAATSLTYRAIRDGDVQERRTHQDIGGLLMQLSATNRQEHRETANRMLIDVLNRGGMGGQAALILSMVANGTAVLNGEDDDEDSDTE